MATAARGHSEKPMLLSVEGHFTLEANPDTGAPTKVLAPDTAGKFYPNQIAVVWVVIESRSILRLSSLSQPNKATRLDINPVLQVPNIL